MTDTSHFNSTGSVARNVLPAFLCLALLAFAISPAFAAFHLMVIQEVFVGPPGDGIVRNPALTPDQRAQYVVLRMTSGAV